jgi:hypothetical protein
VKEGNWIIPGADELSRIQNLFTTEDAPGLGLSEPALVGTVDRSRGMAREPQGDVKLNAPDSVWLASS